MNFNWYPWNMICFDLTGPNLLCDPGDKGLAYEKYFCQCDHKDYDLWFWEGCNEL